MKNLQSDIMHSEKSNTLGKYYRMTAFTSNLGNDAASEITVLSKMKISDDEMINCAYIQ